jgi:hypothetical protein
MLVVVMVVIVPMVPVTAVIKETGLKRQHPG